MILIAQVFVRFFLVSAQLFGSLRMLGRETPWQEIVSYAALQTSSLTLFYYILPHTGLQFMLISFTHFVYFIWVFDAKIFPDTLFCYLVPLALATLGELTFSPLLMTCFPHISQYDQISPIFCPSFIWTSYLPILLVALYFLVMDRLQGDKDGSNAPMASDPLGWIIPFAIIATCSYLKTPSTLQPFSSQFRPSTMLLGASLIALPIIGFALNQCTTKDRKIEKSLHYHVKQHATQQSAIRTLREERHDFLNELTLISTYVQMGKTEQALACIAYSAAKLSDRHNYATLPDDAWLTVLELKMAEAKRRQVDFTVEVQANPPSNFAEQRLLPKLIMNLVDNSFTAVAEQPNPRVRLTWMAGHNEERILTVANNGPVISSRDGKMIFQGGVTSKSNSSGRHGWGLVICKRIAQELGGSLTYESSTQETNFILTLPPCTSSN